MNKMLPDSDAFERKLISQLNWHNALEGIAANAIFEYPFYTDAHVTGQVVDGLGPYSFLNTVPTSFDTVVNAPIILRAALHLSEDPFRYDSSATDESIYHAGTFADELAALVSLCLGIRVRAGGESREFDLDDDGDPLGRPIAWAEKPKPVIQVRQNVRILPSVIGTHSLDDLELLKSIPYLSPERYISLIRACKFYQDALWVAESEPNLAWLMLVSALESAANDLYAAESSPTERLTESKPELAQILEEASGSELVEKVADLISHTLGATKKFMDFTTRFLPDEPKDRPKTELRRVKWEKAALRKILRKVYEYRSRSLHGGIPFPAPMLDTDFYGAEPCPPERPLAAGAYHSRGGTWLSDDTPINLHCFHYIVRGALLNWWHSITNES